jgi:hypothetical protein
LISVNEWLTIVFSASKLKNNFKQIENNKMTPLLEDFKNHTALALLFLFSGFITGLGTYKYVSSFFNADVVLRDSYIYKSDIEKTHVPIERFTYLSEEMKLIKLENSVLKNQNTQLQSLQSSVTVSICRRHANEINALVIEQRGIENSIQAVLSPYSKYSVKSDSLLQADSLRAKELRKHSEFLNQQLIHVRGELAKCGR